MMETRQPQIELTCTEALEIVSASFDGEASLREADVLASHLVDCSDCRRAAEALAADDDLLRRLGRRSPSADVAPEPRMAPARPWLPWAAAAALALALLAGLFLKSLHQPPATPKIATQPESVAEPAVDPTPAAHDDLDAELDRLTAQAETLIARLDDASRDVARQRPNPFRNNRSDNPFAD
ncbi:MAG: zf-HC2 domain-containing protein, partial [Acidobacteriota bacterium]